MLKRIKDEATLKGDYLQDDCASRKDLKHNKIIKVTDTNKNFTKQISTMHC